LVFCVVILDKTVSLSPLFHELHDNKFYEDDEED